MAHELDLSNGRANMAYVGEKPWHGLGSKLEPGVGIEIWMTEAGLDWSVSESPVYMNAGGELKEIASKKALYRSDTLANLSVVGKDFKVVHPKDVLEFFRGLVESHDMSLSTAGSLFGGRRFWALAELGKDFEVTSGDKVVGNLLLTTAVDGSLNTTAKFVSERVVCHNTLTIAMNEKTKNIVRVPHRSCWDPDKVKMDLGLIDDAWTKFMKNVRKLAEVKVSDVVVKDFYVGLLKDGKDWTPAMDRKVERLMDLYDRGLGAEMSRGTLWGAVNGVTQFYTHGTGRRNESHQFWDSAYGSGADMKDAAYETALAMAA